MDSGQWTRIKETFAAVAELPLDERAEVLRNSDPQIREEVEKLLAASDSAGDFIASPIHVENGHAGFDDRSMIGREIDDYVILEKLGEGGMGTVYSAEQRANEFSQRVAIKLIKRGMDTDAVLKRFFIERQILASLDHPNIARLLDGGSTEDGQPYFVMELVEGENIREFCDGHQYDTNERLQLFQRVCHAISYAHQNLIVHRDIKPSNIVVTDHGEPKLLDFGIAKLLSPDWDATTNEATATNFRLMTPEYASPEQLRGQMTTTATDVYSLGVVLYELLTGARPYKFTSKDPFEISREILTIEPLRPSAVSSMFQVPSSKSGNQTDKNKRQRTRGEGKIRNPQSAIRNLKGDLDNIILKAIRKDPRERYRSVEELAEDIDRHLKGLPVTATADSTRYRLSKFIGRNRKAVATATIMSLVIFAISGVAIWQAIVANNERGKAERRLLETRRIANSLMFEIHDSLQELPGATKSRELLVKKALEYLGSIQHESTDNPELLKELSIAYRKVADIQGEPYRPNLGQTTEALENYLKAYEIQNRLLEKSPRDLDLRSEIASTSSAAARIYQVHIFDREKALEFYRISQKHSEFVMSENPNDAVTISDLADKYRSTSDLLTEKRETETAAVERELALKYTEDALQLDSENEFILNNAAALFSQIGNEYGNPDYNDFGEPEKALPLLLKSLSLRENLLERDAESWSSIINVAVSHRDLAEIYLVQKEIGKAKESLQKALLIHEDLVKRDSDNIFTQAGLGFCLYKLGSVLMKDGQFDESLKANQRAVSIYEKLCQQDPTSIGLTYTLGIALEKLAETYLAQKEIPKALENYQRGLDLIKLTNTQEASFETNITQSRVTLNLGKTKQKLSQSSRSYCDDFQSSLNLIGKVKSETRLSPTNTAIYNEAKSLSEKYHCSR